MTKFHIRQPDRAIFVGRGRRVILLGPPSYARTWPAQRLFSKLTAKLESERMLKSRETDDWLQRMLNARRTREATAALRERQ